MNKKKDSADAISDINLPKSTSAKLKESVSVQIGQTTSGHPEVAASATASATKPASDLPDVFGRYQVKKKLGSGAMGAVYLAKDTLLDRDVALKTPTFENDEDGELLKRFYREARAVSKIKHHNLCGVYDVGEIDGRHYISMEFVSGRRLSEFIKPDKPMTEKQAMAVVRKIALAMQEAHSHGVTHRDLKPDNIMINEKGEPVVMDFGLVHKADADHSTKITQQGTLIGSPAYMSKEQIEGDHENLTTATDQYSLGVILYQLLTSKLPFEGGLHAVLAAILTKEPPPPSQHRPDLNPHLEAVCLKMMAKLTGDRYPSMKMVADTLAEVAKGTATQARPSKRSSSTATIPPLPQLQNAIKLPPSVLVMGGIGSVAILLIVFYSIGLLSDNSAPSKKIVSQSDNDEPSKEITDRNDKGDPSKAIVGQVDQPWPVGKREVTVGTGREYKTIADALKAVRWKFAPNGAANDQIVIKIAAGIYQENIFVDGTVRRVSQRSKQVDQPVDPNWPMGIKLLADGEVILQAPSDIPAIRLKNIPKFVVEGMTINATGKAIGVEITGDMNESRLSDLKIRGFTQVGVACLGARGISFGNSQFMLDRLTLEPASGSTAAIGVRMQSGGDGDPSDTVVQGCRFLGPLAAGVAISGAGPYRITISENIFTKVQDGIRCEGAVQWKDISILNNTFHEGRHGIVFANMPAEGSMGLAFRRNLFTKMVAAEGAVLAGYDEARLGAMLASDRPGWELNYSDRAKPATPTAGEIGPLCENNGKRGDKTLTFASTDPKSARFLSPAEMSSQRSVPGAREREQNWVGAKGP
jgi:serine/threonine protein kinase